MSAMSRAAGRLTLFPPFLASAGPSFAPVRVALHAAAVIILWQTEDSLFNATLFVLAWGLFNCAWLLVLRLPGLSAALSLLMVCGLVGLSWFKMSVTWTTISFFDILVVDPDTVGFLLAVFPQLRLTLPLAAVGIVTCRVLTWRYDPLKVQRRMPALGGAACLALLSGLSLAVPEQPWEPFQ